MLAAYNIVNYSIFTRYCNAGDMGVMQAGETNQPNEWAWHTTITRYYAPSSERKVAGGQTINYTYIEGPHGPVTAMQTDGVQHYMLLLGTSHLSSIIGVWSTSATLLEEHRYTAWGSAPKARPKEPWAGRSASTPTTFSPAPTYTIPQTTSNRVPPATPLGKAAAP